MRCALALVALVLVGALAGCASDGAQQAHGGPASLPTLAPGVADPPPTQLIGQPSAQVTRLLGPPDFQRNDGPAEILQYRSPPCVLDLFLYRDAAGVGDYRVEHVEARTVGGRAASRACYAAVVDSRATRRS